MLQYNTNWMDWAIVGFYLAQDMHFISVINPLSHVGSLISLNVPQHSWLTHSMEQSIAWEAKVAQREAKLRSFMETDGSLSCSQGSIFGASREPI
jgi:hypothetical protein